MPENQCVLLKRRCDGLPVAEDFELVSRPVATPGDGQLALHTAWLSLDPFLRGRISGRHLSGAVEPGQVMAGRAVSRVIESRAEGYAVGDWVAGDSGWQSHPVVKAKTMRKVDPALGPVSTTLGILGMPGLTAYAGLLRLAEPRPGDTVLVSAAAGPVGSMVGQIARIKGCRVVGVAGSDEKCAWVTDQARFDACINYKTTDLRAGLDEHCPDGVDIYFDNVGGDLLQAAMERLALNARVVLCGLMVQYNSGEMPPGPNPGWIIRARATVRGLVVYDHEDLRPQFLADCAGWLAADEIRYLEDVTDGLARAPEAFARLMAGKNFGKALVRVAGDQAG